MGTTMAMRRMAAVSAGLVAASVVSLAGPAGAAPGDPTCPAPTAVVASTWQQPKDPTFTPPGSEGYALTYWQGDLADLHAAASLDMDGDGDPDTASRVGDDVVVQRGDGTLTLALPFPESPLWGISFDDLDDDGHAELVVFQWINTPQGAMGATWIVPGTTPAGSATLVSSAIRITGSFIEDVTGDGLDDVAHNPSLGGLEFAMSGAELLAESGVGAGPGPTVQRLGITGDVDFDGVGDQLVLGPADGSEDPRLELSTGPTLALGTVTPTWGRVLRHGTRFYVRLGVQPDPAQFDVTVTAYRVRIGCALAWLRNATVVLGDHTPGPDDIDDFGTETDPWQSSRTVTATRLIRSAGGRQRLIHERYEFFLGRSPDPAGRRYWGDAFATNRATEETMTAELLGSGERFRKSGSTIDGWVHTAFEKALGRPADAPGFSYWKRQAQSLGLVRTARRMLASQEARRRVIRRYSADPMVLGIPVDGPYDGVQYTLAIQAWEKRGFDAMLAELVGGDRAYLHAQAMNRLSPF